MKKIRALIAFACALVATFSLAVPAFAAGDGPYTLTIKSETPGHTYEAYQVFAGDVGADGKTLSNVSWGEGVDGESVLTGLKKSQDFGTSNPFTNCDSAAKVAAVLSGKDTAFADSFAEVVGAHLVTGEAISFGSKSGAGDAYEYTATGLEAGYYLVQDKEGSPSDLQYAKTKFILEVVDDVTAEAKADHPTLDKTIVSVENAQVNNDYANAAVGDTVTFQLTSRVPEMDGYNKYLFAVTDTLAEGFTLDGNFGADDVTVKIDDTKLPTTDYTVKVSGNVITIELTNLLAQRENADKSISITYSYSATVNSSAKIGADGNTNTAYLQFSNDPNHEYTSLGDDADHLGKTPDATVYVYVGGLVIHKVDEGNAPIAGAQFQISSEDFNQIIVVGAEFVEDQDAGTYYKLKNGSYTTVRPSGDDTSDYENTTPYALQTTSETVIPSGDSASVTSWVDAQGKLVVAGLSEGTYTITELTAPDGYNRADAVVVALGWDAPSATGSTCTWKKDGEGATLETVNGMGLVPVTIQNLRGATLPSTGGIGKTVLITAGAVLVLVAGVGLVTKFRAHRMK